MLGEIWKIGDWSVFPAENTLRRDGSEVKVPPRLMDALIFFARHPDHVISRTELVAHLWNRSVVTDQTVTQNIFELRKALRDYQLVVDAELLRTAQTEEPQPDAVSAEGASEAKLGPPAQAAAGQTKSSGKRSKFMDFARSFLLDEVELGFKKYPY